MILLLADDEVITRKGLIENIDWKSLQIHRIIEAGDGLEALELAKEYSPEIILTDIRMPRMDGVQFAFKVREFLPDASIIFMSGFSDKEYLQAAIQLKAVSYVEKPIDNQEIASAVLEAQKFHNLMKGGRYSIKMQQQEKSAQLAAALTKPSGAGYPPIGELEGELGLHFDRLTPFTTILLQTHPAFPAGEDPELLSLVTQLHEKSTASGFDFLFAYKYDSILIFHLYGMPSLDSGQIKIFLDGLQTELAGGRSWFIAAGSIVNGSSNVYESYNEAAVLLQSSFFYDYGSFITKDTHAEKVSQEFLAGSAKRFETALDHGDTGVAADAEGILFASLVHCQNLLPSTVRDVYFRMFIALEQSFHLQLVSGEDESEPIWDRIVSCNTLSELHDMLGRALDTLDERAGNAKGESAQVRFMKEYIHKNYSNSSLSVRAISENAGLSVAYACTLFKNESGTTLNQYLTAYRMEKARSLLADPTIRILDISSSVGYLDGNYFGKSFKKATGLSPSEYREKLLS